MLKKILIPILLIAVSCHSPEPPANTAKPKAPVKAKSNSPKPAVNPWVVRNYTKAGGEVTERKYARLDSEGTFSDSTVPEGRLFVTFMLNKENAGILVYKSAKTNPLEKFSGQVIIKMKNSNGEEVELLSSRGWNKSGGILIEQNNNDYSRFRIFMLQSEGPVSVEIRDESSAVYRFNLIATGFGDSLSQL